MMLGRRALESGLRRLRSLSGSGFYLAFWWMAGLENSLFLSATENVESLLGRDLAAPRVLARGEVPDRQILLGQRG